MVCCAKLEDRYLGEWLEYHLGVLGFGHAYIYDNNADPTTTQETLSRIDPELRARVIVHHDADNTLLLFRAFAHWIATYRHLHKAVAFIDPDEFLVLHKHGSIDDLLAEHLYPFGGALCVNWIIFGDSGLKSYDDRPVTQRFTMRCAEVDQHVKSIVVCEDLVECVNPHFFTLANGKVQRDTRGTTFGGPLNPGGPTDVVQLNHYLTKTFEEWLIKRDKGHVDIDPAYRRPLEVFHDNNHNDVQDLAILQRFQRSA